MIRSDEPRSSADPAPVVNARPRMGARAFLAAALEERLALMAPARRLRLALADEIVSAYGGARPLRLLDAGTGDGLLALALAQRHPDWAVLGVDLREDLLDG